jgi:hypothetical protein
MPTTEDLLNLAMKELREARANEAAALKAGAQTIVMLDETYRERAHLVAHLAAMYPSRIAHGTDPEAPGFAIVYITLPSGRGQCSWHIAERDLDLFAHVHRNDTAVWDGHSTEEKYRRLGEDTKAQSGWQARLWDRAADDAGTGATA